MMEALIFKIALTILLSINYGGVFLIGKPREPHTAESVFISMIVATVVIFGLWYWL